MWATGLRRLSGLVTNSCSFFVIVIRLCFTVIRISLLTALITILVPVVLITVIPVLVAILSAVLIGIAVIAILTTAFTLR